MELYPSTTALELPVKQKIIQVIKIWGWCLLSFIAAAMLISITDQIAKSQYHISIAQSNQMKKMIADPLTKYFWAPFIAPIMEETLFRLWQDYKIKHLLISAVTLIIILFLRAVHLENQTTKYIYEVLLDVLIIVCFLKRGIGERVLQVPLNAKKIIFYIAAVLFGLMHITNFTPLYPHVWFLYPVFILPQIIMGIAFGYARIKYGFLYGFLLHCGINLLSVLIH